MNYYIDVNIKKYIHLPKRELPAEEALAPVIDKQRVALSKVYVGNKTAYASNGKIAVRVGLRYEEDKDDVFPSFPVDVLETNFAEEGYVSEATVRFSELYRTVASARQEQKMYLEFADEMVVVDPKQLQTLLRAMAGTARKGDELFVQIQFKGEYSPLRLTILRYWPMIEGLIMPMRG